MRAVAILIVLAACGAPTAGDDATRPDADPLAPDGPPVDGDPSAPDSAPADGAAPDADQGPACVTTGDGSLYSACCLWDEAACDAGTSCYWHWGDPPKGADDGECGTTGTAAIGDSCGGTWDCVPGAMCFKGIWSDPPVAADTCKKLCDPYHDCDPGEECVQPDPTPQNPSDNLPWSDGTVGVCMPPGGA